MTFEQRLQGQKRSKPCKDLGEECSQQRRTQVKGLGEKQLEVGGAGGLGRGGPGCARPVRAAETWGLGVAGGACP